MAKRRGGCLTAVLDRLDEGPASRDLATAIWGPEWRWPLSWENCVQVYLVRLREEGHTIRSVRTPVTYTLAFRADIR